VTTTREAPDFADLDEEREVDLRKYWNALVARWWLPALGLVAGLIVGYIFTLGGNQVYEATATLYLGQPYSGSSPIQGLPTYVSQVIHSEAEARKAAAAAGLRPGQVKNNVSTQTISGAKGALRTGQTPLITITLTGNSPRKVAVATTVLGQDVIDQLSSFVDQKIESFRSLDVILTQQLASNERQIEAAQAAIKSSNDLTPVERLLLQGNLNAAIQQKGQLLLQQTTNRQQLSQAENVEKPQFVDRPVPVKTTARSTRNSMLVGGAIGLILGIIAALVWGPVTRRVRTEA
jgi:ABC-type Na+ efflux pump permease subunit